MSNVGQAALAVVGGVIGFFVGGPTGAAYGFQLGLLAGSALFPTQLPHLQGPRLGEGQQTVSTVGQPIPWIFGTQTVGGNIIWASPIREVAHTETAGGKGGPEQSQTTYTYFRSFAILLGEGPIGGVRRIWSNGKIGYDLSLPPGVDIEDVATGGSGLGAEFAALVQQVLAAQAVSQSLAAKMTVYRGTEDQLPDPVIESFEGVGRVPAHRGYAYVVFDDVELKPEDGNRIPASWKFEIYEEGDATDTAAGYYSNEVLYPWINADYPVNPLNTNTIPGGSTGAGDDDDPLPAQASVDAALSYSKALRGVPLETYLGHDVNGVPDGAPLGENGGYTNRMGSPLAFEVDVVQVGLHFNVSAPVDGYVVSDLPLSDEGFNCSGKLVHGNVGTTQPLSLSGAALYFASMQSAPDEPVYPAGYTQLSAGACYTFASGDVRIIVERAPSAPQNPCDTGVPVTGLTGYCVVDGKLLPSGEWTRDESTTYKVLQAYTAGGSPAVVTKYPLNPARPLGHSQYNDQAFWEAAYAVEVARGRMSAGLAYGVDYPVTQAFGYVKENAVTTVDLTPVSLASIVGRICERVGLMDYDVSDLEAEFIVGYQIPRPMAARAAIEPLRSVGFFDAVESGTILKFPTRGKAIVATLAEEELGAYFADGGERPPAITTKKTQALELPRQVRVHYQNPSRDFDPGEEPSPARFDTPAETVLDVDLAVAVFPDKAAQIAEILHRDIWASRWNHAISLDCSRNDLEPTDCIAVPVDGRLERMRINAITDHAALLRDLELVRDDDGTYVSHAVGTTPQTPPPAIAFYGPVETILLDLPPLVPGQVVDAGFYVAARPLITGGAFRGAVFRRSTDGGANYSIVGSTTAEATTGALLAALPSGPTTIFDLGNELLVELDSGELEDRTEADVLGGANAAAIGANGRWEIVQFKNAENLAGNVWRLTGLLRGRRGTEHAVGSSEIGDGFVLVSDGALARIPMDVAEVGVARLYQGAALGTPPGDAIEFTGQGIALKPFSPVHLAGDRNEDGDLTIDWIRRDRLATDTNSAMSETVEDYEVDILNTDGEVVRTISVSDSEALYSAEQQTDDFGELQESVHLIVYQISEAVGRGYPAEATV